MTNLFRRTAAVLLIGATIGLGGAATANAEEAGMHGHPDTAAQYWSEQNYDDCAIMAAAHVIGIRTGHMPAEDDIVGVAGSIPSSQHDGPIYVITDSDDPDVGGTDPEDLPALLSHYGVHATYTDTDVASSGGPATGIPALEQYLDSGQVVIASVNANTIWGLPEDGHGAHAVVVTGIDAAGSFVHLNDSGVNAGADEPVSFATFQSAWDDNDQRMVITD
ncbi:MAG: C39 family peptidase [Mycobacterium sp.]